MNADGNVETRMERKRAKMMKMHKDKYSKDHLVRKSKLMNPRYLQANPHFHFKTTFLPNGPEPRFQITEEWRKERQDAWDEIQKAKDAVRKAIAEKEAEKQEGKGFFRRHKKSRR